MVTHCREIRNAIVIPSELRKHKDKKIYESEKGNVNNFRVFKENAGRIQTKYYGAGRVKWRGAHQTCNAFYDFVESLRDGKMVYGKEEMFRYFDRGLGKLRIELEQGSGKSTGN